MADDARSSDVRPCVHIVIVNWNSGAWLRGSIASIGEHGGGAVDRVVVVDNGSTDGSADLVQGEVPFELIQTGANLGFARACNIGAADARAPYLLFLNPDAALKEGAIEAVMGFMESPEAAPVGVCGVRLVGEDGATQRHCAPFPTWRTFLGGATGLDRVFPRLFPPLLLHGFDHLHSRAVDHVIGAFYVIRRALFEELGGFDERFFLYLEDLDLSLRVRSSGRTVHYLAEATAFHKGGGTSERVKAHRLFYALRSRLVYAFAHFPAWEAWAVTLATLFIEPFARIARALLRGAGAEMRDALRAYGWLWKALPQVIAIGRRRDS